MLGSSADRLEFVDAAIRHQRQKEVVILDDVRADEVPMLDDLIVQRPGRTHGSSERERTQLQLTCSRRLPRATTPVAVDARAQHAICVELNCVLRLVVRRQRLVVAPLKLDELPRGPAEVGRSAL